MVYRKIIWDIMKLDSIVIYYKSIWYLMKYFNFSTVIRLRICPLLKTLFRRGGYTNLSHEAVVLYVRKIIASVVEEYRTKPNNLDVIKASDNIWVCWWQGKDDMPPLVSQCYKLLLSKTNGHPLILITKYNYNEFVSLPDFIIDLVNGGKMSITHLSDILRIALLKTHGGLWLDATYWVTQPININDLVFYSPKNMISNEAYISNNRWAVNCLGGAKSNKLFCFVYDAFMCYWKENNALVDYFLIDYLFFIAYENFTDVREMIDATPYTCPDLISLDLNAVYNPQKLCDILERNLFLKLNWKQIFREYNSLNELTNYGFFMSQKG